MAKYDVAHSCGHTETVQLYGKHKDRERRIDYLERAGLCSECYQAHREAQRQAENEAALAWSARVGLVPLKGSEKQVAWAETIRRGFFENCDNWQEVLQYSEGESALLKLCAEVGEADSDTILVYADWCEEGRSDNRAEDLRVTVERGRFCPTVLKLEAAVLRLAEESEAKFWIDHRNYSLLDFAPGGIYDQEKRRSQAEQEKKQQLEADRLETNERIKSLFGELVTVKVNEWRGEKRVYLGSYDGPSACYRPVTDSWQCGEPLQQKVSDHMGLSLEEADHQLKELAIWLDKKWKTLKV